MKKITVFRLLTYILLPFAAFFGLMDIIMLMSAIANPSLLLAVFLIAAFCIYSFASLVFLTKHIDRNQTAKPSLKDWIKVNAYASFFLGFQFLVTAGGIFYMGEHELKTVIDKFLETQSNLPAELNVQLFIKVMRGAAYFLFLFSFVLIVHITMVFGLIKQYSHLFDTESAN